MDTARALRLNLAYNDALRTAGECAHGVLAGELVRPWCGTPVCAICRRRPATWWRLHLDGQAGPAPAPPSLFAEPNRDYRQRAAGDMT